MHRQLPRSAFPPSDPLTRVPPLLLALGVAAVLSGTPDGRGSARGADPGSAPVPVRSAEPVWDVGSDTWVATDALGRVLPGGAEVGPPRADRAVGMFYFLWHGAHVVGGPYDVTRILAQDPRAMEQPDSPLWGPLHAPHHWGESIFGYYRTQDEGVLRKHAQMLGDAGVDVVVFDVTNQLTYRDDYFALLRVWSEVRRAGNRTPAVAFLTPFWDPAKVVRELWRDLYGPGHFADLWYRWEGRPLILADPALLRDRDGTEQQKTAVALLPGHTLGQSFVARSPLEQVGARFPTYHAAGSAVTLSLHRDGPGGERLLDRRFEGVADNAWLMLEASPPLPPGRYYLEASAPLGKVGWWSHDGDVLAEGEAQADGRPVGGDRTLRLLTLSEEWRAIRAGFTFRKPQPDYFRGPTQPDMWSWLEVHPQHVFTNAAGLPEQMSVGVAQNAVGGRLGSMSEPGARGRSFHDGARDARPDAVRWGLNAAEQWTRVMRAEPRFVFVTGWNEWIAGRFAEFNGVRRPVMFVDQFDQEHSRDIEPMRGGHGDDYYYQLVAHVRRYRGARELTPVLSHPIRIDGRFDDWRAVAPEFRDTIGDPVRRTHPGWDTNVTYRNFTGRNDLTVAKASALTEALAFLVETREPLTPATDADWMVLFVDVDGVSTNGWLGYDFVVNRTRTDAQTARVERHVGPGYAWSEVGTAALGVGERALELAVPFAALGLSRVPAQVDFKWADGIRQTGEWSDFTLNGDVAPNDRFNYRAVFPDRVAAQVRAPSRVAAGSLPAVLGGILPPRGEAGRPW